MRAGRTRINLTLEPMYALVAFGLFVIEVLIALFVRDGFVRPYVGDVLAVMLVYAGLRAVLQISVVNAVVVSLVIALVVELSQLFGFLEVFGLEDITVARVVLGSSFAWLDLVAYAGGGVLVVFVEWLRSGRLLSILPNTL